MRDNIISLGKNRLKRNPVTYTVTIIHDNEGMSFNVYDIQDSQQDRLAVARDLEAAAMSLQANNHGATI